MSQISSVLRSLHVVIAFVGLFHTPAGAVCDGAAPLSLPGQWRGVDAGGPAQALRLHVSEATIVALEVTAFLEATEPSLAVVENCGTASSRASFVYLERAATRQVLAVDGAGEVFVMVRAQDPAASIGPFKVTARAGPWPDDLGDPGEDEIDPDPFAGPGTEVLGDPGEDEIDPDPFADPGTKVLGDPGEDEIDPDPFAGPLADLCRSGIADDHADDVTCATPMALGGGGSGEIGNGWRDDEDVFTFVVAELRTVAIESSGDTDVAAALYDRHVQRLAADDDGGDGGNFRVVKTLRPGRYFVRVEGAGRAEGSYRLSIR